jgi:hypothetical protein
MGCRKLFYGGIQMKKAISLTIAAIFLSCSFSILALADGSGGENLDVSIATAGSITIDGIASPGEWDGATTFTVNGATSNYIDPTNLSCIYKLKWDADYLYILETRTDTDPLIYLMAKDTLESGQFYEGNSTLFFMSFDNGVYTVRTKDNNGVLLTSNEDGRDIEFSANAKDNSGPLIGLRNSNGAAAPAPVTYTNGDIKSVVTTNSAVTELKFKWTDLPNSASKIKDGAKIRFYVCDTKTIPGTTKIDLWNDWSAQAYQLIWGDGLNLDISDWNTMTLKSPGSSTPTSSTSVSSTPASIASTSSTRTSNPGTGNSLALGTILLVTVSSLGIFLFVYKKNKKSTKENN